MEQQTNSGPAEMGKQDGKQDARQDAILSAAFEAFRLYGFRRTSMQDIAQGAGMSRAALYLHYRNKEDIFESLVRAYYDQAADNMTAVLAQDLDPVAALRAGFAAKGGRAFEALLTSPHGAELMDTKALVGAGAVDAGEARFAEIFAAWLMREAAAGRVTLAPFGGEARALAATMMAALHGVKATAGDYASYRDGIDRLAVVFGTAIAH